MHREAKNFFERVKEKHPEHFENVKVLDCGSLDVNGSLKYLFTGSEYTGADMHKGKNVDIVSEVKDLDFTELDVVISAEMLEHSDRAKEDVVKMASMLRIGGLLAISAAGVGRSKHGIKEGWGDHYKNIGLEDFLDILPYFKYKFGCNANHKDIYFYGIKTTPRTFS